VGAEVACERERGLAARGRPRHEELDPVARRSHELGPVLLEPVLHEGDVLLGRRRRAERAEPEERRHLPRDGRREEGEEDLAVRDAVLVGRDPARAAAALARLAPPAAAPGGTERRARTVRVEPSGAADAVSASLGRWLAG